MLVAREVFSRAFLTWSFALSIAFLLMVPCESRGYGIGYRRKAIRMSYTYVDPSEGRVPSLPPVILVHGILDTKQTWMFLAPMIADATKRRVYALDMRNHGTSSYSPEFNVEAISQDLECFLHAHGIRKSILVGHSIGAKAIMSLVLRRPELAEKVVFEDMTIANFNSNELRVIETLLQTVRQTQNVVPFGADEATARKIIGSLVVGVFVPEGDSTLSMMNAEVALSTLPIVRTRQGRYMWKANLDAIERAIATPGQLDIQRLNGIYYGDALFLYGTKSFMQVSKDAALIHKYFPLAKLLPVEDGSHLLHQLTPEKFLISVITFINTPPSQNIPQQLQYKY